MTECRERGKAHKKILIKSLASGVQTPEERGDEKETISEKEKKEERNEHEKEREKRTSFSSHTGLQGRKS